VAEGNIPRGGNPVDGITKINVLTKVDSDVFEKSIQLKVWDKIAKINYRLFEEARSFVRSLKLKKQHEWDKFKKSRSRPKDIPSAPHYTYENKGWKSMGDWLGTGVIATKFREYKSFEDAKKFVHKFHLKNATGWKKFKNKKNFPNDIPKDPSKVYKNKYKGLGDWLGTGFIATHERKYLTYNKAKKIVHKLKLQHQGQWYAYWKKTKPSNIPRSASQTYNKNKSWKGWGDFLGTGRIASQNKIFLSYNKAKQIVTAKKFENLRGFGHWLRDKKIQNIPNNANRIYKNKGWVSWGEFLGGSCGCD
jgi:hypothetical protein